MNYTETLSYLYHRLPIFSRTGALAYKKGLGNIKALCNTLDNPQKKIKTIHIAGTNGKGSTSHMLASIFESAGYKTGLLTSPHLIDFRERIRISGQKIQETFVVDFVENIQSIIEELNPSFFELSTAMAFAYFAKQKVDYAIIETGLGGEFDSTNIITPEISLITNIAYDHQNMLGDSLQEIAQAKAGIIKPKTPIFIGQTIPETKTLFLEKAKQQQAPIFFASEEYEISLKHTSYENNTWLVKNKIQNIESLYDIDLLGHYQAFNILLVLSACEYLVRKNILKNEHIHEGIQSVKKKTHLLGRWDILLKTPLIIADVAHNEQGIQNVLAQINAIQKHRQLHILYGMVKDKSIEKVFSALPQNAHYYFTQVSNNMRSKPSEEIQQIAQKYNLQSSSFHTIFEALETIKKELQQDDILLITGSIFLVGEVYQQIGKIFTQIKNISYE